MAKHTKRGGPKHVSDVVSQVIRTTERTYLRTKIDAARKLAEDASATPAQHRAAMAKLRDLARKLAAIK